MCNLPNSKTNLSRSSQKKLDKLLQLLNGGTSYRDIFGHKLHSYNNKIEWISIRLSQRDRAIVAKNRHGDIQLIFVGPHKDYDKIVGPKLRKRLVNPWLKVA
jgi:hypothetical protein